MSFVRTGLSESNGTDDAPITMKEHLGVEARLPLDHRDHGRAHGSHDDEKDPELVIVYVFEELVPEQHAVHLSSYARVELGQSSGGYDGKAIRVELEVEAKRVGEGTEAVVDA